MIRTQLPWLVMACLLALAGTSRAGSLTPALQAAIEYGGFADELPVIIKFDDDLDVGALRTEVKQILGERFPDRKTPKAERRKLKRSMLIDGLRKKARRARRLIRRFLGAHGGNGRLGSLWAINALAGEIPAYLIADLAGLPGVEKVQLDAVLMMEPEPGTPPTALPQWNLDMVTAPELWLSGYTGQDVVVGILDTGVDGSHPDLADRWRGGTNSWLDPYGVYAEPADPIGHGTQAMGVMVGGAASGYQIGMAPGARWIATRIFNSEGFVERESIIHQAFQWMLDPDGDPQTDDAPDVVNNSWALANTIGGCLSRGDEFYFGDDIALLKEAGIAVVFSAGNYGPQPDTSVSPSNDPRVTSVGAVSQPVGEPPLPVIETISSRGPGACDGGIFPKLVAPGANIFTAETGSTLYTIVSGTSFSAPHVAGGIALLKSAFGEATVSQIESALGDSAVDLGGVGADDDYGYGLLDVAGAFDWLFAELGGTGPGAFVFSEQVHTVDETTASIVITVNRVGGSAGEARVDYRTADLTASAGSDYAASTGTLVFADGEKIRTFSIAITDDGDDDDAEEFEIILEDPTNDATLGSHSIVSVFIRDDDGPGTFSMSLARDFVEEDAGSIELIVARFSGREFAENVDYATSNGTAASGLDYQAASGTLMFAAGEKEKSVTIPINNDGVLEQNESFHLILSNATGGSALGNPAMTTVTILDDEPVRGALSFVTDSVQVDEDSGTARVAVVRGGGSGGEVSVAYTTADGTAKEGVHYNHTSGTLVFRGGQLRATIDIPIIDNNYFASPRNFAVSLSSPRGGAALGRHSATTVHIMDNEARPFSRTFSSAASAGGSTGASDPPGGSAVSGTGSGGSGGDSGGGGFSTYHFTVKGVTVSIDVELPGDVVEAELGEDALEEMPREPGVPADATGSDALFLEPAQGLDDASGSSDDESGIRTEPEAEQKIEDDHVPCAEPGGPRCEEPRDPVKPDAGRAAVDLELEMGLDGSGEPGKLPQPEKDAP